ncbi:hypothetical protein FACS1894122_05640 [Alphaproteobacteria bacterium]|nr:hypothetical protein FACS1894122_05640 [Alphaproteobacteria bacterium]
MRIRLVCVAVVLSLFYSDYMSAGALLNSFKGDGKAEEGKGKEGKDAGGENKADAGTTSSDSATVPAVAAPATSSAAPAASEGAAVAATSAPAEKKKIVGDPVVLRIGRKEFKRSQVLEDMKLLPPHLIKGIDPDKLFGMLRDQKMSAYLMVEQAKKAKMDTSKEFIERLDQMKEELLARVFLMKEIAPKAESDSALRTRYAKYVQEFESTKEHHLYHIMVTSEADSKAVLAELAKGKDFLAVAKEKSAVPSKEKGGDEGFIPIQILPSPIKEKLQALKNGEYTKDAITIPGPSGESTYHIFKVTESRDSTVQKFEDCKDALKQMVVQEEVMKLIDRLEKQYKVEKFNEDGSPFKADEAMSAPVKPDAKRAAKPAPKV